ncbi:MAG: cation transporter [Methylobacteriaceae bacterium]|nr:cation transporter [Methylobacteriaceae bacterium]
MSGGHHGHHGHHHGHHGAHGGQGGHGHTPESFDRRFALAIGLNVAIVLLQVVFGLLSNSVALLADAGHNLSDVLGLGVAWVAAILARRAPSRRYTYGLKKSSILAALFNAVFLLVVVGGLTWEAVRRLFAPEPVAGGTVMIVAAIGLVLNAATAALFARGRHGDINVKGAFLHMAADAGVSAGVVAAGALVALTGWLWLDPLVSIAISAVIVGGTWRLLTDSLAMAMSAVPDAVDPDAVRAYLAALPGVADLHDLHIWPLSTTETALTAHLVMPEGHPGDRALVAIAAELTSRFAIGHATLQVETDPSVACPLVSPATV